MNITVYGETGQLARALKQRATKRSLDATFINRQTCDLAQTATIIETSLDKLPKTDVVIIAAAYTAVDKAESETETAFAVNADAPSIIAQRCADLNIPMVYISTDYVFGGTHTAPYTVSDPTAPTSVYGASKLAGETAILASGARASIIRTSWVFDGTGSNFLTTMLRLGQSRETLSVVDDQIGRPTYAGHLADAAMECAFSLHACEKKAEAVFHVSGSGEAISWAVFARAIFEAAQSELPHKVDVVPIPTSEYPTAAARPPYSVMDISHFERTFGRTLPSWREGLEEALKERQL